MGKMVRLQFLILLHRLITKFMENFLKLSDAQECLFSILKLIIWNAVQAWKHHVRIF